MSEFLKPQSPLQHREGAYLYPLTTIDQVILEDNTRLNAAFENVVFASEGNQESTVAPLNADTLGGQLPSYYAKATKLTPRNLLDNSDFTNPVNQRGYTDGTLVNGYFIDRWQGSSGNFNLSTNGIKINAGQMNQRILMSEMKEGAAYTLACKVDGQILCYTGLEGFQIGVWEEGLTALFEPSYGLCIIYLTKIGGLYEWAALYEGEYTVDTLPEYQPKGYGAELAECQRYYQKRDYVITISQPINDNIVSGFNFMVPMRTNPTVTIYDNTGAVGKMSVWTSSGITDGIVVSQIARNTKWGVGYMVIGTTQSAISRLIYRFEASADL